jgi:hypothetical protein
MLHGYQNARLRHVSCSGLLNQSLREARLAEVGGEWLAGM